MNGDDPTAADFALAAADRANERIARIETALLVLARGASAVLIEKFLAAPRPPGMNYEEFARQLLDRYIPTTHHVRGGEAGALRFRPGPLPAIDAGKANVGTITPEITAFIRDSVLEEAAKECERQRNAAWTHDARAALADAAKSIRAMKGKP